MRTLTVEECIAVNGAYQPNVFDPLMVSGAFSCVFGIVGAAVGVAAHLGTATKGVALAAIFASANGVPIITLPIALFAGLGFGGCLGGVVGLGLYYTGIVSKLEQ